MAIKIRHLAGWMKSEPLSPGRQDDSALFMDDDLVDSVGLNADTDEIEIRGRRSTSNESFIFRAPILGRTGTLTIVKGAKRDAIEICNDIPDVKEKAPVEDKKAEGADVSTEK